MKKRMMVLLVFVMASLPALADAPAPASDAVARELAGIRASLDRLADLLHESRAHQRAVLLLRRIERKETRHAALERRLRTAESSLESDREQMSQFELYRTQMEEEIRAARERGEPGVEDQIEKMVRQAEHEEKRMRERIEALENRIRELEDQVAESRETIEDLDLRLEEILALMDESD